MVFIDSAVISIVIVIFGILFSSIVIDLITLFIAGSIKIFKKVFNMPFKKLYPDAENLNVSVIIPAFNEEAYIDKTVSRLDQVLKETELNYELIIVDDGSQDTTFSKVTSCTKNKKNVNIVSYPVNRGKVSRSVRVFRMLRVTLLYS